MKAKIIISAMFLFLVSYSSFAQRKKEYEWGCSVAINSIEAQIGTPLQSSWGNAAGNINVFGDKTENSFSWSIIAKYFINDDILLRFEFGITNLQFIYHQDVKGSAYHSLTDETLNQKVYSYNPGILWSLLKKKSIELYCGVTIRYTHYSNMDFTYDYENRQMPADTVIYWVKSKTIYPGGYSAGIGAFTGFNIYLQKHIALGAEFSSSLLHNKIGGEYSSEGTYQSLPSPPAQLEKGSTSSLYQGFQFSKILSSFNISVWF
jgi:hypothetical protein